MGIFSSDAEVEAMGQAILGRTELAGLRAVNIAANEVHRKSQQRVPKGDVSKHQQRAQAQGAMLAGSEYPSEPLASRSHVEPATIENDRLATVYYEGPYAAAQEVGHMTYDNSRSGKPVAWSAHDYTAEGTGPRYLEDSLKEVQALIPEEAAVQGRIAFGELSGVPMSKSAIQQASILSERQPVPTGEAERQIAAAERQISSTSEASFVKPMGPPILQ